MHENINPHLLAMLVAEEETRQKETKFECLLSIDEYFELIDLIEEVENAI